MDFEECYFEYRFRNNVGQVYFGVIVPSHPYFLRP